MTANPADLGLYWLSNRGSVSDAVIRRLCKKLYPDDPSTKPYWRFTHALQLLGHIEWSESAQHWALLEPYCLQLPTNRFLFCGGRLPGWQDPLEHSAGLECEEQYRHRGPQRWITEEPPACDRSLSIQVFQEKGLELLMALPDLDVAVRRLSESQPPSGGNWESLTPFGQWKATPGLVLPDGLYRNTDNPHTDYFLKWESQCWRARSREEKALAWWWHQGRQRRPRLHFVRARQFLLVPHRKGARLPIVAERALCSSSGLLPFPEHGRYWAYPDIDEPRAREFARIFHCKLEVV